jgi:hypothetical protein
MLWTGKYHEGDETKIPAAVTTTCDSLGEGIDYILQKDECSMCSFKATQKCDSKERINPRETTYVKQPTVLEH